MSLNTDQQTAMDKIEAHDFSSGRAFFLTGGPGTGKSFLTAHIVRWVHSHPYNNVCVISPTHKACGVLRGFLGESSIPYRELKDVWTNDLPRGDVFVSTLASFLGKRPTLRENKATGEMEETFRTEGSPMHAKLPARHCLVIVDECSMVSKLDAAELSKVCRSKEWGLLFVGDVEQLPPVKATPVNWARVEDDESRSHRLTEVMRQKEGSDIVKHSREIVETGNAAWDNGSDVTVYPSQDAFRQRFLEQCLATYQADHESERAVLVAYTNATVDMWADAACEHVYGHGADILREGEVVMTKAHIVARPEGSRFASTVAGAGQLLTVLSCDEEPHLVNLAEALHNELGELPGLPKLPVIKGRWVRVKAHESKKKATVMLLDSEEAYDDALAKLRDWAKGFEKGHRSRGIAWRAFFFVQNLPADLVHPFAITCHRSQGSTYSEVFLVSNDIRGKDAKPLRYVACTRPKTHLHVLV